MNTQIKKAYDKIYMDVHTKQRVLDKLEKRAIQNEFIEENQPIKKADQKIEKVTVSLDSHSKRKYK